MTTKGLSRTAKIALGLLALGATCVPCTGVLAGIAAPAFSNYMQRTRAIEATRNLQALMRGVDALGAPPASLPATPDFASLGPSPRPWPADAAPGWTALGFAPTEPVRYSYAVTSDPVASTVTVEAYGDLNGNGVRSYISCVGHYTPGRGFEWEHIFPVDELE